MAQLGLVAERRIEDPVSIEFMNRDLARSGLIPEDLDAYPIEAIAMGKCGAYVIPYRDPIMWRIRYDRSEDKYKQPPKIRDVWWSPRQSLEEAREQPSIYIIEGEKKAAAFIKKWPHLFAFGIGGAHNALEKTADGSNVLLANILKVLSPGKMVNAIFDGDILGKGGIQQAATNLIYACNQVKVDVKVWYPPEAKGIDDWLVVNPNAKLADLIEITPDKLEVSRKNLYRQLKLSLNEDGNPIQNETNISKLLHNRWMHEVINDKRLGLIMDGYPVDERKFFKLSVEYIQDKHFKHAPLNMIQSSLGFALDDMYKDVIQALLLRLEWDGVPRLNSWGSEHIICANPKLANDWGRLLMTELAFRIAHPGIKVDMVPILVGGQGIGKTTFFEELATFDGHSFYQSLMNFSSDSGDANRTEVGRLKIAVIVDLGEGVIFDPRKNSMDVTKQRLTQTSDTYRIVHARTPSVIPRGFIFVGTSNREDILSDNTGSRRFFMIKALSIVKVPYEKRLQILAEVIAKQNEIMATDWYDIQLTKDDLIPDENTSHIKNVQERINSDFRKPDVLEDEILALIENNRVARYKDGRGYFITSKYLQACVSDAMHIDSDKLRNRISRLSASVTFKYRIPEKPAKPTEPQLEFPSSQIRDMYMRDINNAQRMVVGYQLLLK